MSSIRAVKRLIRQRSLDIQAHVEPFFPGLEAQWHRKRPLVGTLTLNLATSVDNSVKEWIVAGPSLIYFGFGSMLVEDPSRTMSMIVEVCRDLGRRAVIGSREPGQDAKADAPDVMVVPTIDHSEISPLCSVIVHQRGAGAKAASVRSGRSAVALWSAAGQPVWGTQIKRLGVGMSRSLSDATALSPHHDVVTVMASYYVERTREFG